MLQSISLKFTELEEPVVLPAQGITIFVGPNNSGKSLILKELQTLFNHGDRLEGLKIVHDFEINWPDTAQIEKDFNRFKQRQPQTSDINVVAAGYFNPGGAFQRRQLPRNDILNRASSKTEKYWFSAVYLSHFLVRLDGRTRFELTDDRSMGDLLGQPESILAQIFRDDAIRQEIRSLLHDAFQQYFLIDPMNLGQARIRLSELPPTADEQSLNADARRYYNDAIYIKEASDGVQAYVGIITAVLAGEFRAILIDEPEAFLHPPLARKLGTQLGKIASKSSGSLLASTHSADFLMGCIQATKDVRVVRLEYSKGKSKGRVVDPEILETIFRSPLLRSANVISALFYDGVVVTESDNDRAFYAEIYYRLAELHGNFPSVLFINAQNKQTIKDIVQPLRQFGIPAAAIPDIDILKDGGQVWTNWLKAAAIPAALHQGLSVTRDNLKKCFEATGKDMKRDGGIDALLPDDKAAAKELFGNLDEYGVFVVRRGELETWLPELGAVGKKTDWTISVLEIMGSDPTSSSYVKPTRRKPSMFSPKENVWEFMRKIVKWIEDPSRKGTP
jgi:ABC-type cobalamin/Fe3+-siderophores transport system ATPase subunit